MSFTEHLSEPAKHIGDAFALGTLMATLLNWIPTATIILSFVWLLMRCVESWQTIKLNARRLAGDDE